MSQVTETEFGHRDQQFLKLVALILHLSEFLSWQKIFFQISELKIPASPILCISLTCCLVCKTCNVHAILESLKT